MSKKIETPAFEELRRADEVEETPLPEEVNPVDNLQDTTEYNPEDPDGLTKALNEIHEKEFEEEINAAYVIVHEENGKVIAAPCISKSHCDILAHDLTETTGINYYVKEVSPDADLSDDGFVQSLLSDEEREEGRDIVD